MLELVCCVALRSVFLLAKETKVDSLNRKYPSYESLVLDKPICFKMPTISTAMLLSTALGCDYKSHSLCRRRLNLNCSREFIELFCCFVHLASTERCPSDRRRPEVDTVSRCCLLFESLIYNRAPISKSRIPQRIVFRSRILIKSDTLVAASAWVAVIGDT